MTAPTASTSGGGGGWKWLLPVLAAVVLTVIVLPSNDAGPLYDLESAQPDGYRGLRLLLEETGTAVGTLDADEIDAVAVGRFDVVYVPGGGAVDAALARQWRRYVEAGGRLVLGSPSDEVGARAVGDVTAIDGLFVGGGSDLPAGVCAIDDLGDAGPIRAPFLTQGVDVGDGDSCYGDERVALVVRQRLDRGEIVTLATPDLFTNEIMGAPEPEQSVGAIPGNAVVAQRLLGSGAGAEPGRRLGVVTSGIADVAPTGEKSLTDFMSTGVKLGLLELGVAFLFYAWARGRRHGRVVTEPTPVTIAGSAFVEAVGSLLERQGDVPRAAEVVREGQCRELARRLGLPRTAGRPELAAVVAARTGREPAAVLSLLTDPVDSDAGLVTLTRELDSLRQEALHV